MQDLTTLSSQLLQLRNLLTSKLKAIRAGLVQAQYEKSPPEQTSIKIESDLLSLKEQLEEYLKQIQVLATYEQGPKAQHKSASEQHPKEDSKIVLNMYIFQLLNYLCINSKQLNSDLTAFVCPLLDQQIKNSSSYSVNSFKHASIFVHNWLSKELKSPKNTQNMQECLKAFSLLLINHFQNTTNDPPSAHKKEEHFEAQLEWLSYIFKVLFNRQRVLAKTQALIPEIVKTSDNPNVLFYLVHMLNNYYENMVNNRVTTQTVAGLQCPIKDVRQMYNLNQDKDIIKVTLSEDELTFLLSTLRSCVEQYISIVKSHLLKRFIGEVSSQVSQLRWKVTINLITEIMVLFNHVLFIGGYNSKVQDIFIGPLLEQQQNNFLLPYFELSYLLYKNRQTTKYKSKVTMLTQMSSQLKSKLFSFFSIQIDLSTIDIKQLQLQKMLAPGQIVLLLRLLSNLVHINRRAQLAFQKDVKYLHMIMSLTHDSSTQTTMKEWAIIFIKNITQGSEKIRQEIGKVKMEVKVEQE